MTFPYYKMAKPVKKQPSKVKKKTWIKVFAPKKFNEKLIADIPVDDINQCIGRFVHSNMMALTGDIRSQSIKTKLLITEIREGQAYTKLFRYEIAPPAIKRIVRRRRDRIDESLVYKTKDGIKIRIKPFILTNNLAKGSILSEIRRKLKLFIFKKVSSNNFDDIVNGILEYKLQKEIKGALSKIHPLRTTDIRVFHIEKDTAKITPAPPLKGKKIVDADKDSDESDDAKDGVDKLQEESKDKVESDVKTEADVESNVEETVEPKSESVKNSKE